MGLTVKRNDNLEKMFDQLTTQTKTSVEEKEKKNKFLAKGTRDCLKTKNSGTI
ncbi:SPJ_0845 family protein [Pediococcus pentosaceus]|uniref:SPJ_0845 family protein n=1 Tax=Pediococcus pentosaceus TaxID=1255 RepID=UPI00190F5AF8|nr:SPJ_0845 family protein [Pediococcus pentosaceus]